eukprot:gene19094-22867_t
MKSPEFIEARAADTSIFIKLVSTWRFYQGPTADTCRAECSLDYQFKSIIHSTLMDQFFSSSLEPMINAFERRCQDTYRTRRMTLNKNVTHPPPLVTK